jgi:hypothetical protein
LLARFREIVARSSVPMPQVLSAGAPGGTLANALALPSRRGSQVILGATLLEALAPAEIAAIFAHELAHLEEFARRKGRGRGLRAYALMLAAAAVLFFGDGTGHVTALSLLWLTASATVLARSLPHRRAEEVESDRRAVELCGDGETYARALIRLHALARIPRRWAADFERRTTHPSLARRLAAIRGRGPSDQPPPLIVTGPSRTGPVAVLDAEGCRWYAEAQGMVSPDALPVTARLTAQRRYEDLVELRLHATGAEPTALLATGKDGQTWSVRLGPDDARRVQAYLDRIDHRLGEPSEERPDDPKDLPERPPDPPVEWRAGGRRAFAIWLGVVLGIFGLLQVIRLLAR